MSLLPLDWTRLGRQNGEQGIDECPDVLCTSCLPPSNQDMMMTDEEDPLLFHPVHGTALLCLPDADNDWFQGYCFTSSSTAASVQDNVVYKLLCIQQDDADPCLHCDDYQLWTVTVYSNGNNQNKQQTKQTFRNVVSRGGDSIRWHHQRIRFTANAVTSGVTAYGLVDTYFAGFVQSLRDDDNPSESVATIMPNVAVVTGDMTIWLPKD